MTNRQSAISIPRYVFYSTVRAGKRPRPVSNVPCRELVILRWRFYSTRR